MTQKAHLNTNIIATRKVPISTNIRFSVGVLTKKLEVVGVSDYPSFKIIDLSEIGKTVNNCEAIYIKPVLNSSITSKFKDALQTLREEEIAQLLIKKIKLNSYITKRKRGWWGRGVNVLRKREGERNL